MINERSVDSASLCPVRHHSPAPAPAPAPSSLGLEKRQRRGESVPGRQPRTVDNGLARAGGRGARGTERGSHGELDRDRAIERCRCV
ncbi:unnamed protein product [Danaus chrysippus]|uniref:(African queen) hypothetical protein n=1 Tax=Danaus chrysippus TaxID=151541 RepID=A0A8J2MM07_9NEOP|nr:unnamed protein product [Danaus chrysippus]